MAKQKGQFDGHDLSANHAPLTPPSFAASLPQSAVSATHSTSMSSTGSWHLLLPGTPDSLPHIREMVEEAANRCGFSVEEIAKIEMAVDEACTNIIEHGYNALHGYDSPPPELEISAHGYQDRLEILILDRSQNNFPIHEDSGIDVDHYLAEHRRRGLGLYIIRSFVDDVKHRFVEGHGNELLLVKYFA